MLQVGSNRKENQLSNQQLFDYVSKTVSSQKSFFRPNPKRHMLADNTGRDCVPQIVKMHEYVLVPMPVSDITSDELRTVGVK
jgi:hypothetical protein